VCVCVCVCVCAPATGSCPSPVFTGAATPSPPTRSARLRIRCSLAEARPPNTYVCVFITVVLQWCSGVKVVLKWCHSGVTVVSQRCSSGVTETVPPRPHRSSSVPGGAPRNSPRTRGDLQEARCQALLARNRGTSHASSPGGQICLRSTYQPTRNLK
jgi:hypothetical protein